MKVSKIKLFLISSISIAILLAGIGVFYYFAIFIPEIEREKIYLERQKIEQQRQDELDAQAKEEQRLRDEKLAEEMAKNAREVAYAQCIDSANSSYSKNWASNCKSVAERNKSKLENCLSDEAIINNQFMGESYCYQQFGLSDGGEDCSLPSNIAQDLEDALNKRKEQCLVEAQNDLI